MSSSSLLRCIYCGRSKFLSKYGLELHQKRNQNCVAIQSSLSLGNLEIDHSENPTPVWETETTSPPPVAARTAVDTLVAMDLEIETGALFPDCDISLDGDESFGDDDDDGLLLDVDDKESAGSTARMDARIDAYLSRVDGGLLGDTVIDCGSHIPDDDPSLDQVKEFRSFCEYAHRNFAPLNQKEKFAIDVLHTVYTKGAPLDTYESILLHVFRRDGVLGPNKTLKDAPDYISRTKIMEKLALRYRMYPKANRDRVAELKAIGEKNLKLPSYFLRKEVFLPHRQAKVPIIFNDFKEEFERLLTDPRLKDTDFDFFICAIFGNFNFFKKA